MFDFGKKWTPASFALDGGFGVDLRVRTLAGLHLALVSGNTEAGLARLGIRGGPLGATAIAPAEPYALALARDRCLAVSPQSFTAADGWYPEGFALTAMNDAYVALEFSGRGLPDILAQATTLDWAQPTRSAAIVFAALPAAASFHGTAHTLRLFVETPLLPALARWLDETSAPA